MRSSFTPPPPIFNQNYLQQNKLDRFAVIIIITTYSLSVYLSDYTEVTTKLPELTAFARVYFVTSFKFCDITTFDFSDFPNGSEKQTFFFWKGTAQDRGFLQQG